MDMNTTPAGQPDTRPEEPEGEAQPSEYKNDPEFQKLMSLFQSGDWNACVAEIDRFLQVYPEDPFLVAFRQEVMVRLALQQTRDANRETDRRQYRQKFLIRFGLISLAVLVMAFLGWVMFNSFQDYQTQLAQARATANMAQELATQYQAAEEFLHTGRAVEALAVYEQIQKLQPAYRDVPEKLERARQEALLAELYQKAQDAFAEGKLEQALEFFLQVKSLDANYKETEQAIKSITSAQKVAALLESMQTAYDAQDWLTVVQAYDEIKLLDSSTDLSGMTEALFISHKNLVDSIASKTNLTLEEIEAAEKYYRTALALSAQNKDFAVERAELERTARSLLANKYYLHSLSVLKDTNYSMTGLTEAIRLLNKAYTLSASSPVIRSEIENTQLFLDSYDLFLKQRWADSITGFELLYRREEIYADGLLNFLLFEAHTAQGDILLKFSDYEGALREYQSAEQYARRNPENIQALFQAETRTAAALVKIWQEENALEFYRTAFDLLEYRTLLTRPDQQVLLADLNSASNAVFSGNNQEALQFYTQAMDNTNLLYDTEEVSIVRGDTLSQIAFLYNTTIDNIRAFNTMGESLILRTDTQLIIPVLSIPNP